MSGEDQDLVPLGELASRAIAAERARPASADPSRAASRDALFGRVLTTVGVATATTAALAGAASTAKAATNAASATGAATAAASTASGTVGAVVTAKAAIAIAVVAFAAGTGTGAIIRGPSAPVDTKPTPTVTTTQAPPTPSVIAPPPSIDSAPSASATPSAAPPAPHLTSTATSQITSDADLAAERALVDRARSALARGDTAACLEATAAHEKRYPTGRLAEERELIAIEALARDHRTDEAQSRADRFRRKYPNSVFTSAINRIAPPQN